MPFICLMMELVSFNTQPPEGGCIACSVVLIPFRSFNTQPPEGGCLSFTELEIRSSCFNTQPPEGGCKSTKVRISKNESFNTQPPEGGCTDRRLLSPFLGMFQHTATRRWLLKICVFSVRFQSSFNTQPPEGGCDFAFPEVGTMVVSTHSHPKVAANVVAWISRTIVLFQHTATRRWLPVLTTKSLWQTAFQHTATRRWLHDVLVKILTVGGVSTHSHPKVAA